MSLEYLKRLEGELDVIAQLRAKGVAFVTSEKWSF